MNVLFLPSFAKGELVAPPSKSMAHRALFAAALSKGESRLSPISLSEDMLATMDVLTVLGASFSREGEEVQVHGMGFPKKAEKPLFCRESGSTLRFVLPLCLLNGEETVLKGSSRLMERPLSVYEDLCRKKGFLFERKEDSVLVQGKLESGEYSVPGNISSQFITGLLFALSLLPGESVLYVTEKMESASYLDMTLSAMESFGVSVKRSGQTFIIPAEKEYHPQTYTVEGDYSNAAFLDAFNLMGGQVLTKGLKEDSLQGDRVYRRFYEELSRGFLRADLSDCPDLAPVLFALAAAGEGGEFTGIKRLRIKESDRGAAMAQELAKCGVPVTVEENRIVVPGHKLSAPTEVIDGQNDHRIVMAMSILLSRLGGEIQGAQAVAKSYPNFFEEIRKLGIEVIEK